MDASYNVHGTRSVQRLIQVCNEPDMVKDIMDALRGNIASLSSHSNGNHVIQRCLQHMPDEYRVDVFEEVVKSCMEVPSLSEPIIAQTAGNRNGIFYKMRQSGCILCQAVVSYKSIKQQAAQNAQEGIFYDTGTWHPR